MPDTPWTMCVLGQFRLERDGEVVARFYDRKPDRVLAYIALHRDRPIPRVELATAVWPDRDPTLARNRLSENLHYIRRDLVAAGLPEGCLRGNRHVVELSPEIDSDVWRFENAVAEALVSASQERRIELLGQAVRIYGDGLLPSLSGGWLGAERVRLGSIHASAARQLASSLTGTGAFEEAPEITASLAPEDLARQWVRSQVLAAPTPGRLPAAPRAAEPWVPGKSLDALERRLADRAVSIAEQAEPHLWGPERAEWLARLDAEYSNIEVALRWAIEAQERETALKLSSALWPYWDTRGKVAEGRGLAESALALGTLGRSTTEAKAVHGAGVLAFLNGDLEAARTRLVRARDLWVERDEPEWLGRCLNSICVVEHRCRNLSAAREHARQAMEILRGRGSDDVLVRVLKDAALVEIADGNLDRADSLLEEGIVLARRGRSVAGEARLLGVKSSVAQHREQWRDARDLTERSIAMLAAEDDFEGVAFGLRSLGYICSETADKEVAWAHFSDSLTLSQALGSTWGAGQSLQYLAELAEERDDFDEARSLYERSLEHFALAGDQRRSDEVQTARDRLDDQPRG